MLTIQEAGGQILNNNPGKFYVFSGPEYGVKEKYIQALINHYGAYKEVASVKAVLDLMSTKHLIPLAPTVYVARYDEDFITGLSAQSESIINSSKIIGTIVCIYESPKHAAKCAKFLPNYTVSFDGVSKTFLYKYLKQDFPELDDSYIEFALKYKSDYKSAWNICSAMSKLPKGHKYPLADLSATFNCEYSVSEAQFKEGIAAKDFRFCKQILDNYPDDIDGLYYSILNVLLELDRITDNKYAQSDYRPYADNWTKSDIYHMFMNTYEELRKSRQFASYNTQIGLMYLISLLPYRNILPQEVLV